MRTCPPAVAALVLLAAPVAADTLAACRGGADGGAAVSACVELRLTAARGDLVAAREAARRAAEQGPDPVRSRMAQVALDAGAATFDAFVGLECRRRGLLGEETAADTGDLERACRADLQRERAERLWGEAGGRPAAAADLRGRTWRLVQLEGAPILAGTAPDLTLEDGRAAGDAGTNRWFAGYHVDGTGIAFGTAGSTMMFNDEPPGRMEQERRYLQALAAVNRWRLRDGRLELLADDRTLLAFE